MAFAPALGAVCGHERRSSARRGPQRKEEEGLAGKKTPLALAAPPTYSIAPAPRRKGEDEEEEEKERRGWGGITGYKDRLGGMVEAFWSVQQRLFLSGSRSSSSPSYECRMLIAAAWVPQLLLETELDSEVVQLWTGRDI